MSAALSLVFFASGAAALLFETLWFRQAGLMLGNSVWATSLVTSSFMAGLALGNALAFALGGRLRRPVLAYAALEATVGIAGLGLVLLLPLLPPLLAASFTPLLDHPALLNTLRFSIAFVLLLLPATAMGATLPVLARALSARDPRFARVLGSLYGWNTLGAVAGALAGEAWLVAALGLRGTGVCAAALDGAAALAALALSARFRGVGASVEALDAMPGWAAAERRLLAAAALAGAILLSLEVVWFRLLLLFVFGTSLSFAVMLAVVLLGIGLGGLLAGLLLRAGSDAWRPLPALALAAGAATAWTYAALPEMLARFEGRFIFAPRDVLALALPLMLPSSLLSGALFTLMGTALKTGRRSASRAVGALTFANTVGAMAGSLLTGFLLLPGIGLERALFALASCYGIVALLATRLEPLTARTGRRAPIALGVAAAAFGGVLSLFPWGLMRNHFLRLAVAPFLGPGVRVQAQREGLTETITYLVRELWDQPVEHRLLTNGISMSSSQFAAARYMRLFVHWPVAVHPDPKRALLVCYGVGLTAKALTQTRALQSIDVVDTSRDILELGRLAFPEPGTFPLDDRRVQVHVEDGRFFLLTTEKTFDLITAEPPPPKHAGIASLYSREYFELVRKRLAHGGITTYWLPVYQLEADDAKAILRGFCDVFEDCSLWTGKGLEWMLVGTREARGTNQEEFERQWHDPVVAAELRKLGFDNPELLGATFLADAPRLRQLVAASPPLDDDHPLRIAPRFPLVADPLYWRLLDVEEARRCFESSPLIRRLWPEALRERTLAAFHLQRAINRITTLGQGAAPVSLPELADLLTTTSLRIPILVALGASEPDVEAARQAHARGVRDPFVDELLAVDALAGRDFGRAADRLRSAARGSVVAERRLRGLRALVLALGGRAAEARATIAEAPSPATLDERQMREWLEKSYPLN